MALQIMVNGIPGKMGIEVAQVVLDRGYELVPYSITGDVVEDTSAAINGVEVELIKSSDREKYTAMLKEKYPEMIVVDYTHPSAVNMNAEYYVASVMPFVMGTTGGDREKMLQQVQETALYAVIAPNMAKQIVGLQAMLEWGAATFPGLFDTYTLHVVESHQKTKADTSGTAKSIVASLNKMGLKEGVEDIELVRKEVEQMNRMKVPREYLDGHAFHTYNIDSSEGSVHFEIQHNVCGRRIYAEGTIDAAEFLARQIEACAEKTLYNMIDVLKSGAMR